MKPTFLQYDKPLLTVMLQCENPDTAIYRIRKSLGLGADAYGLQVESLKPEYHHPDTYKKIFSEMQGRPIYVTNYRSANNAGRSDDVLAEGLLTLADAGATLCDVMGDLYDPQPDQIARDAAAIERQEQLIRELHRRGVEVLMSSHLYHFAPADKVLEIAVEQKRRGADIIKIVTGADTMEQQIENLRITNLLKQELGAPFLFLSGGKSSIHRRVGMRLGCCMCLCVYEHDALSTKAQPLLTEAKAMRDDMGL